MLLIHIISTWLLVGLIWLIQLRIYPALLRTPDAEFHRRHWAHCLRVAFVLVPFILVEAGSAADLLYIGHREKPFLAGVGLIALIWISTALIQAPIHASLLHRFDAVLVRRLVRSNWIRTAAWTLRGVLVGWLLL